MMLVSLTAVLGLAATAAHGRVPSTAVLPGTPDWTEQRLEILESQLGLTERTGRNDGPHIDAYLASTGLGPGYPYCYAGIYWSGREAARITGLPNPLPRTASTQKAFDVAMQRSLDVEPPPFKPGDVLIWRIPKKYQGHAETVVSGNRYKVVTIGMNTSSGKAGSQRNGGGNYRRTRVLTAPLGRMYLRGRITFTDTTRKSHERQAHYGGQRWTPALY